VSYISFYGYPAADSEYESPRDNGWNPDSLIIQSQPLPSHRRGKLQPNDFIDVFNLMPICKVCYYDASSPSSGIINWLGALNNKNIPTNPAYGPKIKMEPKSYALLCHPGNIGKDTTITNVMVNQTYVDPNSNETRYYFIITFVKYSISPSQILLQTGPNPPADPKGWCLQGYNPSLDVNETLYEDTNVPICNDPRQILVGNIEKEPRFYSQFKIIFHNACALSAIEFFGIVREENDKSSK